MHGMESLTNLFLRLSDPLYRYAFSRLGIQAEAEEAVQDVFLALLKGRPPKLEDSYLFQAVRNRCTDLTRRRQRELQFDWIDGQSLDKVDREQWLSAQQGIRELPEEQREVLILRSLCGLTLAEVAAIQDAPLNTAASRHRDAIKHLTDVEDLDIWLQSLPKRPVDEGWKRAFAHRLRAQQQTRQVFWAGLVMGVAVLLGWKAQPYLQRLKPRQGALPRSVHHLKVHPLMELDGKSKEEILELRRKAVAELPELGPLWRPDQDLELRPTWKEISSGKRWLGLEGQLTATSQDFPANFHRGDSMESFFVLNPMALIGLQTGLVSQHNQEPGKLDGARRELVPASIVVDGPNQQLELTYQIGTHSPVRDRWGEDVPTHSLNLVNAYEMGFTHYTIDSSIGFSKVPKADFWECAQFYKPLPVKHGTEVANQLYIRTAGFVLFRLDSVPARLQLKLWRNRPEHLTDPPDLTEVIQVIE